MKYLALLVLSIILYITSLHAQYRRSILVKAGEDLAQAFSTNGFYRFPHFAQASLYSKKQSGPSAQLFNYNLLSSALQYINQAGDTMEMTNSFQFDSVVIDKKKFYPFEESGFLEELGTVYNVRLVKKTIIKIKPETMGAYGGSSNTSAVGKLSTFAVGTSVYHFSINDDAVIKESNDWFWMDKNNILTKATKKNLLSLLPASKQVLAASIISGQKTNFNKEEDLVSLVAALKE